MQGLHDGSLIWISTEPRLHRDEAAHLRRLSPARVIKTSVEVRSIRRINPTDLRHPAVFLEQRCHILALGGKGGGEEEEGEQWLYLSRRSFET